MEKEQNFKVSYIFYFALILLLFLAIASYTPHDAGVLTGGVDSVARNWIGKLGAACSHFLFCLIGLAAYIVPLLLFLRLVRKVLGKSGSGIAFSGGAFLVLFGLILLLGLSPELCAPICDQLGLGRHQVPQLALAGGTLGQVLAAPPFPAYELSSGLLRNFIGAIGTMICGWAFLTGGLVLIYICDWHRLIVEHISWNMPREKSPSRRRAERERYVESEPEEEDLPAADAGSSPREKLKKMLAQMESARAVPEKEEEEETFELFKEEPVPEPVPEPPAVEKKPLPAAAKKPAADTVTVRGNEVHATITEKGEKLKADSSGSEYVLPPVSMLGKGSDAVGESPEAIERAMLQLQHTLDSFSIPGQVVGYTSGPRITQYEIKLSDGVNVRKVEQIADNISMNLSASSIRVLAPIPGRDVVGVEIPNCRSDAVFMRAVMESDIWQSGKAGIPVVLGKNVAGNPVVLDLAKAPHLLIAGSTGSGKSVCMNTLIMSLLFKFSPDDLRLIMVDPKIVEFEDYRKLPHLITPVINDAQKVPIALRWAVSEMENRYKIMARAGVKKLADFNALSRNGGPILDEQGEEILDSRGRRISKMPILITIIDELAELRMQDSWKDSETYIARIAQLGRAAGVHIVVATQRPSTNIITGVIKANLPTRVAFRVLQLVDSRVILDMPGAEKLLGMGDMLYLAPGAAGVERVQGALVDDKDIKAIVKFVSDQRPQRFDDDVISGGSADEDDDDESASGGVSYGDDDDVFDDMDRANIAPLIKKYLQPGDDENMRRALEVVILDRKASTSYIQRRLKIGYNKAAELVDAMEERGIVGPPSGSGSKREILIFDGMDIED